MPEKAIEALKTDTDLALTAAELEQIEAWRSAEDRQAVGGSGEPERDRIDRQPPARTLSRARDPSG